MKDYEALLIIEAEKEASLKEVTDAIIGIIAKAKGEIKKEENWGKQRLPYAINKKKDGVYYRLDFSIEPEEITGLKNNYKLNQDILRVTITKK